MILVRENAIRGERYMKNIRVLLLVVVLVFGISGSSLAGELTDRVRKVEKEIIDILADPALKGPEKEEKRKHLIRKAVDRIFAWREMTKRALALHWRKRTEEEKKEFIELFGDLLERTYIDKVEGYSGEEVVYVDERVEDGRGVVETKVVTEKGTEIPVKFRLMEKNSGWYVYDICIEGVSLINNYRTQFNSIIMRSSYQDLVKRLKSKVEEG